MRSRKRTPTIAWPKPPLPKRPPWLSAECGDEGEDGDADQGANVAADTEGEGEGEGLVAYVIVDVEEDVGLDPNPGGEGEDVPGDITGYADDVTYPTKRGVVGVLAPREGC